MKHILRILHVDDDPDTRFLMRELLHEAQKPDEEVEIEWLEAGDVVQAVEKWGQTSLDGLFVDNRLGARDGVEEIPRLRSTWSCPIWVVTGVPEKLLEERAIRNGAAGLLTKEELLADSRHLRETVLRVTVAPPVCRSFHPMGNLLRVLMLEDSAPDAELAARALRSAGWELNWRRVETAESFTHELENQGWDVVLADLAGLDFSAEAALEQVRQRAPDVPFIVVSGSSGEDMAVTLQRAGAADFIHKGDLHTLGPAVECGLCENRRRRRYAEDAQRVLAERWQLLLDHASDGVVVHQVVRDQNGAMIDFRYVEWNQAAERILQLTRAQVLGRTGREVFPGAASAGLLVRFARAMQTGVVEEIEGHQIRSTKPPRVLDISCIKLDAEHFVTVFRDVTERQEAERRLRQYAAEVALGNQALAKANSELESHNEELEEFAHVASHDLQEPLRKVVSFGDLLARALGDKLDPKCAQYLALMQDATRRLQTLIRDLLVMSRASRTPLKREPIRLEQCVRAALDLLSARLQETSAVVHIDPLPSLVVDPTQICQLYQNLVSNALKFGPTDRKPEIRVTCEIEPDGPVLGVVDNGIGIEPEYHERIFEAFQRLHSREKYEGSGIGLAVCRKIVNRHGGTIWVESRLGEGCHFRFRLGQDATALQEPTGRE